MSENELDQSRRKERGPIEYLQTIEQHRYLIKKYFWWLVDEYGLTHLGDYFHFQNDKVWVEISLGRKTPSEYLCRVGDDPVHYMANIWNMVVVKQ